MFDRTGLQPENAFSLEQINALHQMPLEDVPEYIAREVAIRHKIPDEFFFDVKGIKVRFLGRYLSSLLSFDSVHQSFSLRMRVCYRASEF